MRIAELTGGRKQKVLVNLFWGDCGFLRQSLKSTVATVERPMPSKESRGAPLVVDRSRRNSPSARGKSLRWKKPGGREPPAAKTFEK